MAMADSSVDSEKLAMPPLRRLFSVSCKVLLPVRPSMGMARFRKVLASDVAGKVANKVFSVTVLSEPKVKVSCR